ncbi:MAG: hypothetical protein WC175_05905 [Candidatus Dojkabacteria bacterium]
MVQIIVYIDSANIKDLTDDQMNNITTDIHNKVLDTIGREHYVSTSWINEIRLEKAINMIVDHTLSE